MTVCLIFVPSRHPASVPTPGAGTPHLTSPPLHMTPSPVLSRFRPLRARSETSRFRNSFSARPGVDRANRSLLHVCRRRVASVVSVAATHVSASCDAAPLSPEAGEGVGEPPPPGERGGQLPTLFYRHGEDRRSKGGRSRWLSSSLEKTFDIPM